MPYYDFWRTKRVTRVGQRLGELAAAYTLKHVRRAVKPLQHLVEVGPGRGALADLCRRECVPYTAVDANAGLLDALNSTPGVCAFVPPLPMRDAICDAVVASHVLEHAPGLPQAEAMLSEMRRIVRPGGCVAITSPDLLWVREHFWDCDYSHNFPTSARRLYQLFLDQGFEIAHLGYVHNHLTGPIGHLVGRAAELAPYRVFAAQPNTPLYSDQIYKIRLTFARAVLVVGRRPSEAA
jgi:ubiquinone/menaquinone biosynthesis C-methylase UbiE